MRTITITINEEPVINYDGTSDREVLVLGLDFPLHFRARRVGVALREALTEIGSSLHDLCQECLTVIDPDHKSQGSGLCEDCYNEHTGS